MTRALLQVARVLLAALAVGWAVGLLGWVPEALAAGRWLQAAAGVAVAALPAWGYTRLTALLARPRAQPDR